MLPSHAQTPFRAGLNVHPTLPLSVVGPSLPDLQYVQPIHMTSLRASHIYIAFTRVISLRALLQFTCDLLQSVTTPGSLLLDLQYIHSMPLGPHAVSSIQASQHWYTGTLSVLNFSIPAVPYMRPPCERHILYNQLWATAFTLGNLLASITHGTVNFNTFHVISLRASRKWHTSNLLASVT